MGCFSKGLYVSPNEKKDKGQIPKTIKGWKDVIRNRLNNFLKWLYITCMVF